MRFFKRCVALFCSYNLNLIQNAIQTWSTIPSSPYLIWRIKLLVYQRVLAVPKPSYNNIRPKKPRLQRVYITFLLLLYEAQLLAIQNPDAAAKIRFFKIMRRRLFINSFDHYLFPRSNQHISWFFAQ